MLRLLTDAAREEIGMQTSNRLFDDLARVASGAFNTLSGLREEIETRVRERVERMAADLDLVSREEFDAVRAMAAKARAGQELLEARLAGLEAELAALKAAKPTARRPRSAPSGAEDTGEPDPV
jgi:BMFP domain-containing protein YqiC